MVAKLSLPNSDLIETVDSIDSIEIVNTIIDERVNHTDFFNSLKNDWIAQVLSYQENNGDPCILNPLNLSSHISTVRISDEEREQPRNRESSDALTRLTQRRKDSLKRLYHPDKEKELYLILDFIRNKHKLNYCPCCGSPGKPTTLDHYLPQSLFPELSIVIENLTPMCTKCNELKDNNIKDCNDNRLFIHPYYDPIDQVQLELEITTPYGSPSSFIAVVPTAVPEPFRSVIIRHLGEIKLLDRFEEFCIEEYTDLLSTLAEEKADDGRDSVQEMILTFYKKAKKRSTNKWVAIFYRGILANIELLDYLEQADLSEYLEEA